MTVRSLGEAPAFHKLKARCFRQDASAQQRLQPTCPVAQTEADGFQRAGRRVVWAQTRMGESAQRASVTTRRSPVAAGLGFTETL